MKALFQHHIGKPGAVNHTKLVPVVGFFLLLLCFGLTMYAQSSHPHLPIPVGEVSLMTQFNKPVSFTAEEGFPLQSTSAIITDDRGFMWIGGQGGLVRFDGSTFTEIPLCVEGSEQWLVRDLVFDEKEQLLWIATWGYGLLRLELNTYTCTQVYTGTAHKDKYLYWIYKAPDALWFGKAHGMTALFLDQDTTLEFSYLVRAEEREQLSSNRANNMLAHRKDMTNDSILWIGTVEGLLRFNLYTHQFQRYYYDLGTEDYHLVNSMRTIHQEPDGRLLLGTWGGGVVRFDPADGSFDQPANRTPDFGDVITSIVAGTDGQLLVSSADGIQKLDPDTWVMGDRLENDLEKNLIYSCKFIDGSGRIFTGRGNNFVIYDPLLQQFPIHQLPPELVAGMRYEVKQIIGPDTDQNLWITVHQGAGIYRYHMKDGRWAVVKITGKEVYAPLSSTLLSNGKQLHLTGESLFYEFDPVTLKVEAREIWDDPRLIATDFLEHSDGSYWFSTQVQGVVRWQAGERTQYLDELRHPAYPDHPLSLSNMVEDSLGNVWINSNTGYSVYDYRRDTFYNFPFLLPDTTELVDLNQIVKDQEGGIWLLSYRHGLMKVSPEHPERGGEYVFDDLVEKNIQAGSIDQQGRIWIYSTAGLECFDPRSEQSQLIGSRYGLPDQLMSMGLLEDGRLYLGLPGGFSVFHPDSLKTSRARSIPYISGISIFDRPLDTGLPVHQLRDIDLSPQQNFFSIRFSSINFTLPERDSFAYQLEGIDPDWVYTQDRREVFYTDVPSGDYRFKLRSANSEGSWNPEITTLDIHIATPWWKTIWAIVVYMLLAGCLLYWLYRFHLSRQLALAESERLIELNQWKNEFYTNITHEFRTPLTVILGISDNIQSNLISEDQPEIARAVDLIHRNGQRLLRMVNEMLDLAKLEHGSIQLEYVRMDVIPFILYHCESYRSLAQAKKIDFTVSTEMESLLMDVDQEKMSVILSNLIINAVKFTPEGGAVAISFAQEREEDQTFLLISVRDTGPGLTPAEQEAVFQRFYQVAAKGDPAVIGSGIGLNLTKQLVEKMGGQIRVHSVPGDGTAFLVRLPVTRLASPLAPVVGTAQPESPPVAPALVPTKMEDATTVVEQDLVLLIEDHADVAEYIRSCLTEQYMVIHAPDGKVGIALAIAHIPDLIICDVMMPGMDGFAVCDTLKNDERTDHIPIVMLTARATTEDRITGIQQGADAYLAKPFHKQELLAWLEQLIDMRARLQRKYESGPVGTAEVPKNPGDAFIAKTEGIVFKYLDDEYFSAEDLALELHLSPSQTYRKLKALTGMSTAVYIRYVRLHRAAALLKDSSLTISEVAYRMGFSSPAYFSQVFKELFGKSPSAYREHG